jgi:hypothetical protein
MALRWMDGFDFYGASGNVSAIIARNYTSYSQGNRPVEAVAGRFDGYGIIMPEGKGIPFVTKAIDATGVSGWYVGFNFKLTTSGSGISAINVTPSNVSYVTIGGKGVTNKGVSICPDGSIVLNGTNVTSTGISANTWAHCEVYFPNGAGTSEVWINGVSKGTTTNTLNYNGTWKIHSNGLGEYCVLDDFYILDNTGSSMNGRLATTSYTPRIETLRPTSDDNIQQYNLTGAITGALCVNPFPHSSSRYIESSTLDAIAVFNKFDLPTISNPKALAVTSISASASAGVSSYKHLLCDSNGCVERDFMFGTTSAYSGSTPFVNEIFEYNPITSSSWSESEVNALKFGVKNTHSGLPGTRTYQVVLQVLGTEEVVPSVFNQTASGGAVGAGLATTFVVYDFSASGGGVGSGFFNFTMSRPPVVESSTNDEITPDVETEAINCFVCLDNQKNQKKCVKWKKINEAWVASITVCTFDL